MNARRFSPWLMALFLGSGLCLRTLGQLADTSPFLAPGTASNPAGGDDGASIELRGIMSTSGGYLFCIYDPAKKAGTWVNLNEGGHDFVVRSADPAHDLVTVQSSGRTFTLALHQAKVTTLTEPVVNMPNRSIGPFNGYPGMNRGDAARRLDAVAAEVRRRRLLREQADQVDERAAQMRGAPPEPGQ